MTIHLDSIAPSLGPNTECAWGHNCLMQINNNYDSSGDEYGADGTFIKNNRITIIFRKYL